MIRINDWAIDADSRCYIIGKPKTRVTKEGKVEEYLADTKYYPTLPAALNGIIEAERRNIVHSRDMTLEEAVKLIRESWKQITELFEKVTHEHFQHHRNHLHHRSSRVHGRSRSSASGLRNQGSEVPP